MAYINFYDEKEINQYRANLAEIDIPNISIGNLGNGLRISVNDNYSIKSLGSNLHEVFKTDLLNFATAPVIYNNFKGFKYHNKDNTIQLYIYHNSTYDIDVNFTGSVPSGNSTIQPTYSFNKKAIGFRIMVGTLDRNVYYSYNSDSMAITLPDAPRLSSGVSYQSKYYGGVSIVGIRFAYSDNEYTAYNFINTDIYRATKMFVATAVNPTYATEVQTHITGVILERKGVALKLKNLKTNQMYSKYGENDWKEGYEDSKSIYGMGIVPLTNVLLYMPNYSDYAIAYYDVNNPNKGQPDNTDPNPDYPSDDNPDNGDNNPDDGIGGDGDGDKESDEIPDDDTVETFDPTGLITIYKMNQSDIQELGKKLWSDNFLNTFLKITQNPIDSLIELKAFFFPIPSGTNQNIMLGNFDTEILSPIVSNAIIELDFGNLNVNEFFGDFKDYNPSTKISIFLPFIGVRDLNTNEVMGSVLHLVYHIDILSNDCIALLTVTKQIDGTNLNSVLYQFEGTCQHNIPVSAASANTIISARISQFQSIANGAIRLGNNRVSPAGKMTAGVNAVSNVLQNEIDANHLDVTRTGSLSGSTGHLGILTPYIIIERPVPYYPTSYDKTLGVPSNRTKQLGSLNGYTEVLQIYINNFTGLQSEYDELISILKSGVIF